MPADTNSNGDIFGGWLMSQMDIAGGMLAKEVMQGRCATVAADAFKFIRPVNVGDIVCCFGQVKQVGTTSMTVGLEVWVKRQHEPADSEYVLVTAADFTYVAIDDTGAKREFPKTDRRLSKFK
ncbi:MAG: hotdog domain-containing protein [Pseudomonadota bacterium]